MTPLADVYRSWIVVQLLDSIVVNNVLVGRSSWSGGGEVEKLIDAGDRWREEATYASDWEEDWNNASKLIISHSWTRCICICIRNNVDSIIPLVMSVHPYHNYSSSPQIDSRSEMCIQKLIEILFVWIVRVTWLVINYFLMATNWTKQPRTDVKGTNYISSRSSSNPRIALLHLDSPSRKHSKPEGEGNVSTIANHLKNCC